MFKNGIKSFDISRSKSEKQNSDVEKNNPEMPIPATSLSKMKEAVVAKFDLWDEVRGDIDGKVGIIQIGEPTIRQGSARTSAITATIAGVALAESGRLVTLILCTEDAWECSEIIGTFVDEFADDDDVNNDVLASSMDIFMPDIDYEIGEQIMFYLQKRPLMPDVLVVGHNIEGDIKWHSLDTYLGGTHENMLEHMIGDNNITVMASQMEAPDTVFTNPI